MKSEKVIKDDDSEGDQKREGRRDATVLHCIVGYWNVKKFAENVRQPTSVVLGGNFGFVYGKEIVGFFCLGSETRVIDK